MAMSPPEGRGKESTSVGLFLWRKRRLSSRRRVLLEIRISTSPFTLASVCARRAKRWSCAALTPGIDAPEIAGSKITIGVPLNQYRQNKAGGPLPPSRQEFY